MSVHVRLKTIRNKLNLKQSDFALPLGIDRSYVAALEKGSRKPSDMLLELIGYKFSVSVTYIKTGEGEMFITPEESLESQKTRFGERAFVQAVGRVMRGTTVPFSSTEVTNNDVLPGDNKEAPVPAPAAGAIPGEGGGQALASPSAAQLPTGAAGYNPQGSPRAIMNEAIKRYGAAAVIESFNLTIKEHGLAVAAGHQPHRSSTGDPRLDNIINTLYDLWAVGDENLKGWAVIQFNRAIPAEVVEEAQKKQQETTRQASAG